MSGRVTRRWRQDDQSLMVRMHHSREHFALALRRTGFPEAAEHALRVLPDPANGDQIAAFLAPYGITLDELVSRMAGTSQRDTPAVPGRPSGLLAHAAPAGSYPIDVPRLHLHLPLKKRSLRKLGGDSVSPTRHEPSQLAASSRSIGASSCGLVM